MSGRDRLPSSNEAACDIVRRLVADLRRTGLKTTAALDRLAPFLSLTRRRLDDVCFRQFGRVTVSLSELTLVKIGSIGARRWLANWHRAEAKRQDFLADMEELEERLESIKLMGNAECVATADKSQRRVA